MKNLFVLFLISLAIAMGLIACTESQSHADATATAEKAISIAQTNSEYATNVAKAAVEFEITPKPLPTHTPEPTFIPSENDANEINEAQNGMVESLEGMTELVEAVPPPPVTAWPDVPRITSTELVEMFDENGFKMTTIGQENNDVLIEVTIEVESEVYEIEVKQFVLVDIFRVQTEDEVISSFDEIPFTMGAVVWAEPDELCFIPNIPVPNRVDPNSFLYQEVSGTWNASVCYNQALVLDNGDWVVVKYSGYLVSESDWRYIDDGEEVSGFVHYEYGSMDISEQPRDQIQDQSIIQMAEQIQDVLVLSHWEERDINGPIQGCGLIAYYWYDADIPIWEARSLCDIRFPSEVRLKSYRHIDDWVVGNTLLRPTTGQNYLWLPERVYHNGLLIEIGQLEVEGCYRIWFTYVSQGQIHSESICAQPGDYVFIGPRSDFRFGEGMYDYTGDGLIYWRVP